MIEDAAAIPVHVVTGFLGSGKTTLLRQLLAAPGMADTAVLVNELGEVALDHYLLERVDETTVVLEGGCLCCQLRTDLAAAMRELLARRARGEVPAFRRLVIETTGLADPAPILRTLLAEPVLRHHYRLAGVVTTVDAVNAPRQLERHDEWVRQVAAADCLVLTKTDLCSEKHAGDIAARLRRLNPQARLVHGAPTPDAVAGPLVDFALGHARGAPPPAPQVAAVTRAIELEHDHAARVQSFALVYDEPLDWSAFGVWLSMLLNRHGESVLRMKALLCVDGDHALVAVHGVQHVVHPPVHLARMAGHDGRSRLVFIVQGLDPDLIARSLAVFHRIGGRSRPAASN